MIHFKHCQCLCVEMFKLNQNGEENDNEREKNEKTKLYRAAQCWTVQKTENTFAA